MNKLLQKYWWIITIIIILPVVINIIILQPAFIPIVGESKDWLNFWAVYLSSIITAIVPFVILFRTLDNNCKENETNRNLQLNIFKYQQEQRWLDQFRKAAAEYATLYSYNDLVDVANIARKDPYKAFYLIKDLFTRAGKADMDLTFIQRPSDSFQKLSDKKTTLFIFYNSVLYDIQILLTIRIGDTEIAMNKVPDTAKGLSNDMLKIVKRIIEECPNDTIEDQFNTAIMTRIKIIEECEEKLRNWFYEYIYQEQKRIDNILKQS